MNISVVLNAHENSPVFRSTLESIKKFWTDDVLVVVDAFGWAGFEGAELPAHLLKGFHHGKPSSPHRNVALGLMKSAEMWPSSDWTCYLEYDCLVGPGDVRSDLKAASEEGFWILGNDHRRFDLRMPFLDSFLKTEPDIHYLLGCCLFFSSEFMSSLKGSDFFARYLNRTNFFTGDPELVDRSGRRQAAYDISEYLYPTVAVHMGGRVKEFACWNGESWRGDSMGYPMRFRPELASSEVSRDFRVAHPIKDLSCATRRGE